MFSILIFLSVILFPSGSEDGYLHNGTESAPLNNTVDDFTLTLVNDFTVPVIFGLEMVKENGTPLLCGVFKTAKRIYFYQPETGILVDSLLLNPANASCFGVVWNGIEGDSSLLYTNDWAQPLLYLNDGSSWTTTPDPCGLTGRGMDFDGTDYWAANSDGGLWRFQPGSWAEEISIPYPSYAPSGLTVYQSPGGTGIAVTGYSSNSIFFYNWNAGEMTFLGDATCPVSNVVKSYGLAWCENSGHFFWSYKLLNGTRHIAELECSMADLNCSSWGSIKTSF